LWLEGRAGDGQPTQVGGQLEGEAEKGDPQFESSAASSGYRPANLRFAPAIHLFSLAFQLTSDLRRLPISGSAFQPQPPTLHRLSDPSANLPVHFQLAPSTFLPIQPSRWLSTCVSNQPSGSAFVPACDRRHLPNLQPCPPIVFQLAPSVDLPAQPSGLPIRLAPRGRPSSSASKPNLRLSSAIASAGAAL